MTERYLCVHGHFYQPPRQNPWLEAIEAEESAAPFHDWNERITAECYAPNTAARIIDGEGRILDIDNTYAHISFNFGPTLLAWLEKADPITYEQIIDADRRSRANRGGHGNAIAQAYNHIIMPLANRRDKVTQVLWGIRDFQARFGRDPEGMWLPETAVDLETLDILAAHGIRFTILSPHQAKRIRVPGDTAWSDVSNGRIDPSRPYRCLLPSSREIALFFYDAPIAKSIAFEGVLARGEMLIERLLGGFHQQRNHAQLVHVATDGETYGHNHRFGEMALAFALRALAREPGITLAGPAAFRERHPPAFEVEIAEGTSWSCPHGVERWRADCGCRVGREPGGSQAWRAPLREAIDWLRDELAAVYETRAGDVLRDPWGARDRWVDCILEPARTGAWLAREASRTLSPAATLAARRALELARHALLMQTSCGWFFDDLGGLEPVLVLRHAARAIELAEALGARLEDGFLARLEPARANRDGETGVALYRRAARGAAATPARVAATEALLVLHGEPPEVPGYALRFSAAPTRGRLVADAEVREEATGATARVHVAAERAPGAPARCRAGEQEFTLADAFGVQHERLLAALVRGVEPSLHEELRRPGAVLPAAWLATALERALDDRLRDLPRGAADALALLDLVEAAGVRLDLGPAQVRVLGWWQASPPEVRTGETVAALCARLAVVPEET
jgi:alpha-amylase/alpha-mannosidase (GH57 family)